MHSDTWTQARNALPAHKFRSALAGPESSAEPGRGEPEEFSVGECRVSGGVGRNARSECVQLAVLAVLGAL